MGKHPRQQRLHRRWRDQGFFRWAPVPALCVSVADQIVNQPRALLLWRDKNRKPRDSESAPATLTSVKDAVEAINQQGMEDSELTKAVSELTCKGAVPWLASALTFNDDRQFLVGHGERISCQTHEIFYMYSGGWLNYTKAAPDSAVAEEEEELFASSQEMAKSSVEADSTPTQQVEITN